jgi:hypothetical protein
MFFSHNKSVNDTFSHDLSAQPTRRHDFVSRPSDGSQNVNRTLHCPWPSSAAASPPSRANLRPQLGPGRPGQRWRRLPYVSHIWSETRGRSPPFVPRKPTSQLNNQPGLMCQLTLSKKNVFVNGIGGQQRRDENELIEIHGLPTTALVHCTRHTYSVVSRRIRSGLGSRQEPEK